MIKIISPHEFKKLPWKNGKGSTLELAISEGASENGFDWRLSIASVVEDGPFSDFSGYLRHLILIEGAGISLIHNAEKTSSLNELLSVASFDGQWQTVGQLHSGPIKDFNLITRKGFYEVSVTTLKKRQPFSIGPSSLSFIYSLSGDTRLQSDDGSVDITLAPQHLMQLDNLSQSIRVQGEMLIAINLLPILN